MLLMFVVTAGFGQSTGSIRGKVVDKATGEPLPAANVVVKGTTMGGSTDINGEYEIKNLAPGTYTIIVRLVGHEMQEIAGLVVTAGVTVARDVSLVDASLLLGDVTVYGASKRAERITEAPAAISTIAPRDIQLNAAHGQLPRLLEVEPGVDVVQSGIQDFNINTRGFNSSLNRRLLVLMDGRDLAIAFLGSQEWNGLPVPLEDIGRLELVRGPGSALYGPNAFNGVINITTPAPRDVVGTKVTLSGGELSMFRGDVRHAGISGEHLSYKANIGRVQSNTWSKSRLTPPLEYAGLTPELRALDDGDVTSMYGSGRIDYTFEEGYVATVEGGFSEVQNEVFVTGIGRVQVMKAHKPWGRVNLGTDRLNIMLWGQGRNSVEPQYSLASGAPLEETSSVYNAEVQYNFTALEDQLRAIAGASHRLYNVDTESTLMAEKQEDNTSGLFGQVEYSPMRWIKLVAAARYDRSTLHESEVSPKGAVVWSPDPNHSFRATYNQAFQVPNYSEFFLRVSAGSANVPFFASPTNPQGRTPILARGNSNLSVETITGYEFGYKGIFLDNTIFVTVDAYFNQAKEFITDLLQTINPQYPFNVPPGFPAGLVEVARSAIPGLAVVDGRPAIVVSYGNAGKVDETGTEVGVSFYPTNELRVTGNWTWYDFEVKEQQKGDILLPNAPKHKFALGATYRNLKDGYEIDLSARNVQPFRWAAGIFQGNIPAYTLVNLSGGYQISRNYRIGVTVSNLLDHDVYQLFGGSVIGRQAIGTITATF